MGYRWITAKTCSLIQPNCNYCILFDVCCVLTVRNNCTDLITHNGMTSLKKLYSCVCGFVCVCVCVCVYKKQLHLF